MCNPIVADPFDVDRVYMTLGSMVFPGSLPLRISRDGGKTFEASVLPEERHVSQIHPDPHHRGVLLALGYPPEDNADGVELLLSRDYGSSWTQIPAAPEWQGKAIAWCNLDPENDRLLCAAVSTARTRELSYWFTYDDGRTWELLYEEGAGIADTPAMRKKLAATFPPRMDLPHLRNRDLTNLIVAPSNPRTVYYISSNEDLMRTLDGGETWECISGTLNFHTVERVIPHPKRAGSAFCHAYYRGYRTDGFGAEWRQLKPGGKEAMGRTVAHPTKEDTLFVFSYSAVWRSDDGGVTWAKVMECADDAFATAMFDPNDEDTFHFLHSRSMRTTRDGGKTWSVRPFKEHAITGYGFASYAGRPLAIEWRPAGRSAERTTAYVFRLDEEPYEITLTDVERGEISRFAIHPRYGTHLAAVCSGRLFFSTDAGVGWERTVATGSLDRFWRIVWNPTTDNEVYCVNRSGKIEAYNVQSESWRLVADAPINAAIVCFSVSLDGTTFWVGTRGSGVWYLRTAEEPASETHETSTRPRAPAGNQEALAAAPAQVEVNPAARKPDSD